MLDHLSDRLDRRCGLPVGADVGTARQVLTAVRDLHSSAPPDLPDRFCAYVRQWQKGLVSWRKVMVQPVYWRDTITDYDAADWTTSDSPVSASA
jgi:hypothetical protein